ncbi:MAG: hypothetical protein B7Y41_11825 [Hydrogenophilales bacterium 28-61-23]|nr:MAG: hypothetical protein B7Y41_11825 [Hydrogenophilales bacterium 28-61-23]
MSKHLSITFARALSAFALTLAMASPASAGQCDCHGRYPAMPGAYGCPYMPAGPGYGRGPACDYPHAPAQDAAPMVGKALGVMVSDLSDARLDELGLGYGIEVKSVQPDTAAAAAGIKAGDLILEFAGKPVTSAERLRWLVRKAEAGKSQEIKLMRDGKPISVNATLNDAEAKTKCMNGETKANGG